MGLSTWDYRGYRDSQIGDPGFGRCQAGLLLVRAFGQVTQIGQKIGDGFRGK